MAKIMIVDDSSLPRKMFKSILTETEHTILEASGGIEAIQLYTAEKPDLVFLDLVMKDMHGLDVLTKLREIDPQCRVIIVTADIQHSTKEMAFKKGALDYISKPFNRDQIIELLNRYL
ncbi:MAG: response regulator [Syntrophobacterales bacterium]|nr:response regulator [Syntrophobacterales bacterium]